VSDVAYSLPSTMMTRASQFGTANRAGPATDAQKSSTGPGSYTPSVEGASEYVVHHAPRFGSEARAGMAMKTPSPGAVYNLGKTYWNGPSKQQAIGFNCDNRKPLHEGDQCTKDADMYMPRANYGQAKSIAGRLVHKAQGADTPGAVYDVANFYQKYRGPEFSFGRGKGERFGYVGILKGSD